MTAFVADAMLGSLARKLRALGFDTSYHRSGGDAPLLKLALRERRMILTSDRQLAAFAAARGAPVILLTREGDGRRLSELAAAAASHGLALERGEPRCSLCGGPLAKVTKAGVSGRVPSAVLRAHRLFYRCTACSHVYWKGSHWKKLRSLSGRLVQKQLAPHSRRREERRRLGQGDPGCARKRAPSPGRGP